MARTHYDTALKEIQMDVVRLSYHVTDLVDRVTRAMCRRDHVEAQKVLDEESQINEMRINVEEHLIRLTATQHPMAIDLRMVFAASRIITDLKRIADHAIEIARCTLRLQDEEVVAPASDLMKMSNLAIGMINDAVNAYIKRDAKLAIDVAETDDTLDVLNETVYREMTLPEEGKAGSIKNIVDVLLVARALENIGDHASSMSEWVVFYVTGNFKFLN